MKCSNQLKNLEKEISPLSIRLKDLQILKNLLLKPFLNKIHLPQKMANKAS